MWFIYLLGLIIILPIWLIAEIINWRKKEGIKKREIEKEVSNKCKFPGCTNNAHNSELTKCRECGLLYCPEHISNFELIYETYAQHKNLYPLCNSHYNNSSFIERMRQNNIKCVNEYKEREAIKNRKIRNFNNLKKENPNINKCYRDDCFSTNVVKCKNYQFCGHYACKDHICSNGECDDCWDD